MHENIIKSPRDPAVFDHLNYHRSRQLSSHCRVLCPPVRQLHRTHHVTVSFDFSAPFPTAVPVSGTALGVQPALNDRRQIELTQDLKTKPFPREPPSYLRPGEKEKRCPFRWLCSGSNRRATCWRRVPGSHTEPGPDVTPQRVRLDRWPVTARNRFVSVFLTRKGGTSVFRPTSLGFAISHKDCVKGNLGG